MLDTCTFRPFGGYDIDIVVLLSQKIQYDLIKSPGGQSEVLQAEVPQIQSIYMQEIQHMTL